ncbi:MAG: hypothetical protein AB1489_32765, partial [Acidobacteriota bacterium]
GLIANLPKLTEPPASLDNFRKNRIQTPLLKANGNLKLNEPILYPVIVGRDAPSGRNMMFAKFIEIMNYAERELLIKHIWPPFPTTLLDCCSILNRETYYFDNCQADQVIQINIIGKFLACSTNLHGASADIISAGILQFAIELYEQKSNKLLVVSKSKKLLAVPSAKNSLLRDAERLLLHHGETTANPS